LNERRDYSVNSNETESLLIKGDNLEALKALLPYYYGKIKAIYIDPPYNTGNENWIYNDNVNSPEIKKWLGKVVGGEAEDLSRHDKWLCMIYPRLRLLSELLSEDGAIFISIDDNEQASLKLLCDEVFNETNFISKITVQSNPRGSQASKFLAEVHEYIIIYAKSKDSLNIKGLSKTEESISEYVYTDEKGSKYRLLGLRQRGGAWKREQRPHLFFPLYVNPKNNTVSIVRTDEYCIEALPKRPTGEEGRWTWSLEKVKANINALVGKKVMRKGLDNFYDIFRKDYLYDEEGKELTTKPKTVWAEKQLNYQNGRNEIKEIFGADIFDYPKPSFLVKKAIEIIADSDSIILDSFAGSGTTGHAVLDLNKEDGGNRKFILVEMENDIAESITAERLKRLIQGYSYKRSNGEEVKVEGLGGGFKFLELGNPLFDKHKQIIGEPSYEDLAGYIYFTETRCTVDWRKANRDDWYVGENGGVHYFMIYGDKSELGEEFLEIAKRYHGKKVVYADAVMIDDDELERFDIIFKQIPYEIKTF
jgi:adenine specific DNA methylase Mod